MKKVYYVFFPAVVSFFVSIVYAAGPQNIMSPGGEPSTAVFKTINSQYTGDWQQYGQLFTSMQGGLFNRIFLMVLTIIPAVFLLHYILIGAKKFSHEGTPVYFFGIFTRFIHWLAALSFSLLVITGLLVVFGKLLGGGSLIMTGRSIHLVAALSFVGAAVCMFLIWVKDMFPMPYDILWALTMGGYLSKKVKPVQAGKFNAGQKVWFWLATLGGSAMAYTGWYLFSFTTTTDQLRIMAMIHNFLAAGMIAFFLVHLYMSLFAIKGSLTSMISGYKPRKEVEILHSRFKIPS